MVGLLRGPTVAKVTASTLRGLVTNGGEAEWVSDRSKVKVSALWSAGLATGEDRGTIISTDGLASLTEEDAPWLGRPRPVRVRCVPVRTKWRSDPPVW